MASHPAVAALPRRVVDVGVLQSVVVALHEDADLRAAVDLHPARRLAHSAHEDVGRVCAQRPCSDVPTPEQHKTSEGRWCLQLSIHL